MFETIIGDFAMFGMLSFNARAVLISAVKSPFSANPPQNEYTNNLT
jgi:hypothetical protein